MSKNSIQQKDVSKQSTDAPPVQLFQGYDSFMSAGRSTAVKGTSRKSGAVAECRYEVCYDTHKLQQAMHISASAAASFGFGSASAKTEFSKSLSVTNTSVTIVVYTNIVSGADTFTNVELDIPKPTDLNAFFQAYGDSFVNQMVTGAEYIATYVFYTESIEEQKSLALDLEGSGISPSGGSLSGKLQTNLNSFVSNSKTRTSVTQFMSGFQHPQFPPEDQIIDFALKFGTLEPDAPTITSYEVSGYEHVPGMPPFNSIAASRALFNGIGSQPGLSDDFATLKAVQNEVAWLKSLYATYGYSGDTLLEERGKQIDADIKTLDTLFFQIDSDPAQSYAAPVLESLDFGTPELNCQLTTEGPYGGTSGQPFNQVTEQQLEEAMHVTQLSMRGGSYIDRLSTTYHSESGAQSYNQGGGGGTASPLLTLQSGERIVGIKGTYGSCIYSLEFKTSFDKSLKWSLNPKAAPKFFTWTATESTALIGFSGRSDNLLESLGLIIGHFGPARWVEYTSEFKSESDGAEQPAKDESNPAARLRRRRLERRPSARV
jgi:hypothetical protein